MPASCGFCAAFGHHHGRGFIRTSGSDDETRPQSGRLYRPLPFSALSAGACARESRAGSRSLPHCSFFLSIHFTISLPARPSVFRRFFFLLLLFSMGAAVWFFGIAAKFEAAAGETLRLALLLAVRNPGWTLFFILLQAAALFVCWFFVYLPLLLWRRPYRLCTGSSLQPHF